MNSAIIFRNIESSIHTIYYLFIFQRTPSRFILGDVKDIEDYKQKIRKQKQLQNKTIKAVKEHFSQVIDMFS